MLPIDGNTIGNIDQLFEDLEYFKIAGWAAIKGQDADNCQMRAVLIGDKDKYSLSVERLKRQDITAFFKNQNNYDDAGFSITILKSDIPKGKYKVAVIIKNNQNKQFLFNTNREINNK